jgi:hypothetical protein
MMSEEELDRQLHGGIAGWVGAQLLETVCHYVRTEEVSRPNF